MNVLEKLAAKNKSIDSRLDAPRRDIQGLRALAVLAVIADHLLQWPRGGFVGVDVFFVVSGFLITGLIFREHQRTGRISFADFYRRRARRILPASLLVLLVTTVAASLIFLRSQAWATVVDALWSMIFAANWHLAAVGTQYFAQGAATSPLQHYWSLAVEEQFYLVWPLLLVGVLALKRRPQLLLAVVGAVTVGSLGFAVWQTAVDPGVAYFHTLARAWELGVGALLAVITPRLARLTAGVRQATAWIGLLVVVGSLFVVTEKHFPAPWALMPVLGTALVIIGGVGGSSPLRPLTNRVARYVGDISYSLYLWHFPVVILLAALLPPGLVYDAVAVAMIIGLSVASYHLVENPVRHSRWLEPRAHATVVPQGFRRDSAGDWAPVIPVRTVRRHEGVRVGVGSLAATMALAFVLVGVLQARPDAEAAGQIAAPTAAGQPAVTAQQQRVAAAASARQFPIFNPPVDSLDTEAWLTDVTARNCMGWDTEPAETSPGALKSCDAGDPSAERTVILLGDSYAAAWMPTVTKAFLARHWQVHVVTKQQCPTASVTVTLLGGGPYAECDQHRAWSLEMIKSAKPDLVILADAEDTPERLASGAEGAAADAELVEGYRATLAAVAPYAGRTVLLTPPPKGKAMQGCVTRIGRPADCATAVTDGWSHLAQAMRISSEQNGAQLVDTHLWFCTDDGTCPGFVGSTPIRVDDVHLTTAEAEALAPVLAEALKL